MPSFPIGVTFVRTDSHNFCAAMLISRRDELWEWDSRNYVTIATTRGGMLLRNDFESLFMTGMALNSGKSVVNGNKSRLARDVTREEQSGKTAKIFSVE